MEFLTAAATVSQLGGQAGSLFSYLPSTMATIYQRAFLTIAATESTDSAGGCFAKAGPSDETFEMQGVDSSSGQGYHLHVRPVITHFSHSPQGWWMKDFPLLSRGLGVPRTHLIPQGSAFWGLRAELGMKSLRYLRMYG